jgi:hypothetical protein
VLRPAGQPEAGQPEAGQRSVAVYDIVLGTSTDGGPTPQGKALYRRRGPVAGTPFGDFKHNRGFRRGATSMPLLSGPHGDVAPSSRIVFADMSG